MKNEDNIKQRIDKKLNEFEHNLLPSFPKNMLVEISNICNHKCLFCANSKMTRSKGEISADVLRKALKEAYTLGTREVGFYATGEPLTSKNLENYIKLAKEIGYDYVYITTNGALFDEKRIQSVIESGIDSIKFSINAGSRKTYKLIHGEDNFEKVIRNLIAIDKYRKWNNIDLKLYVSYVITKQNKSEINTLNQIISKVVDDVVFMNSRNQGGIMYEINEHMCLEETKYEKKMDVCSLPFNSLTITHEGYLSSCCIDFQNYLTIADLNIMSLEHAWNSQKFREFRRQHLEGELEDTICFNCINNTKEKINPLTKEHASKFKYDDFDKTEEITKRLQEYHDN